MKLLSSQFLFRSTILLVLALCIGAFTLNTKNAEAVGFERNLKQGDQGEDVRMLQKMLNEDPVTLISVSGPGSYGEETGYFGEKTYDAVVRFQQKYRQNVLIPGGLSVPTGFVGPLTRSFLQTLTTSGKVVLVPKNPYSVGVYSSSSAISSSVSQENPNLQNLDRFMSDFERVGKAKGQSEADIERVKDLVKSQLSTTTDLKKKFVEDFKKYNTVSLEKPDFRSLYKSPNTLAKMFEQLFLIPKAIAAGAGIPFGGQIYAVAPCACSGTYILGIEPLPPTYVGILTYTPGIQMYLGYNLPFSLYALGFYEPVGICLFPGYPCEPIYNEGAITPEVGSSGL